MSSNRGAIWLKGLLFGAIAPLLIATPTAAAEQLSLTLAIGEVSVSMRSLRQFAENGALTDELRVYSRWLSDDQLQRLRQVLQLRLRVSPVFISQVSYSPVGEAMFQRLGEAIVTDSGLNGFHGLRSALILAAQNPDGFSAVDVLQQFPASTLRIDLQESLELARDFAVPFRNRATTLAAIQQQSEQLKASQPQTDFSRLPDLRSPGSFQVQKQTLTITDSTRNRTFPVNLYLPQNQSQNQSQSTPVIVITHGVAENRLSFNYLANHLASHGFAIAVPENPDINNDRFQAFFKAQAPAPESTAWINQALDVKVLLDELDRLSKTTLNSSLDLQRVGVIGHSQGGTTALLLAGATPDPQRFEQICTGEDLPIARLIPCNTLEFVSPLPTLQDDRIQAAIAISPVPNLLIGPAGMAQIQRPVMIISASNDTIAPMLPEQIEPFTWLTAEQRYLTVIENATHFSPLQGVGIGNGITIPPQFIGPSPEVARAYVSAIGTAFFQTYVGDRSDTRVYLTPGYASFISSDALPLFVLPELQ